MSTSRSTVLRLVRALADPVVGPVTVVGVDARTYSSDTTDGEWRILAPLVPAGGTRPAWVGGR